MGGLIAPVRRLYLDTNIFIRLFEGNEPLANSLTALLLSEPHPDRAFLATSEFTLAEVLVDPQRKHDDRLTDIYNGWLESSPYLEVGPVNREVLYFAAVLRADYQSSKLPDTIHVSTAIGMDCSHFMTADERIRGVYRIAHGRFTVTRHPADIEVIRPEPDLIQEMIDR